MPPFDNAPASSPPLPIADTSRTRALRRGLHLEYLTVLWNVIEGVVAVLAATAAGSVALLGFGMDSFVEMASGGILIWRLRAERHTSSPERIARLDQQARKLVGISLFLLAAWVCIDATRTLITRDRPDTSHVGIALTTLSMVVMVWLAKAKRTVARDLDSRAMESDAFQTTACFWLSVITLGGMALNALFGWWWADPVAALGMTWFLVAEGRQAIRGEVCGCSGGCHAAEPEQK